MFEAVSIGVFSSLILLYASWLAIFALPGRSTKGIRYRPDISVIIPAHNEENAISSAIDSLLDADYPSMKEIIVVDDGSTDGTGDEVRKISSRNGAVKLLNVRHGGKANAVNFGTEHASNEVIVVLDADSVVDRDSLKNIVKPLSDPRVGASSGFVRARQTGNPLTWFQDIDYILSSGWRYVTGKIDMPAVLPGMSAFRKSALAKAGGFSTDTFTEDFDIAMKLKKAGFVTRMCPDAVVHADVPKTLSGLARQRVRWGRGTIQTVRKHSDLLFAKKGGIMGSYTMPTQLFWYVFSLVYLPFVLFSMFDGISYFVSSNNLLSPAAFKYVFSWMSMYGVWDGIANIASGLYHVGTVWLLSLAAFLMAVTYMSLVMAKFARPSLRNLLAFFFFFPYSVLVLSVQGYSIIREVAFGQNALNMWEKNR